MTEQARLTSADESREQVSAPGTCAQCNRTRHVMVQMEHRGQRWELCGPCWIEGVQPFKLGNIAKALAEGSAAERKREQRSKTRSRSKSKQATGQL